MSQTPVPFGLAIVSKSGFERQEFYAEHLRYSSELSKPHGCPACVVFKATIGKDQWDDECGLEWTVWLDDNREIERDEVVLVGSAEIHGSQIGFELPTLSGETSGTRN